jgi:hypothetical protein
MESTNQLNARRRLAKRQISGRRLAWADELHRGSVVGTGEQNFSFPADIVSVSVPGIWRINLAFPVS